MVLVVLVVQLGLEGLEVLQGPKVLLLLRLQLEKHSKNYKFLNH
jgi:hypothetical protein